MRRFILPVLCFAALLPFNTLPADDATPVTGLVQDKISLYVDQHMQKFESPQNKNTYTLHFCDTHVVLNSCIPPARQLKIGGTKTEGIKIDPQIEGEWRFSGDYSLGFIPKTVWRADTEYTVSFLENLFPSAVKLRENSYSFTTEPLYLKSKTMDYFQDPNDLDKKLVNTQLNFNYPVDVETLKKALSFTIEGSSAELPFTVVMADNNLTANVTVLVAKLEKSDQFMNLVIHDAVKTMDGSGTLTEHHYTDARDKKEKDNEFAERVRLPSIYDYLKVESSDVQVLKNSSYVPEQILLLSTSAKVSVKDLPKFVEVKLLPQDKPVPGLSPKKNYVWSSPNEVGEDMRKTLPDVTFTPKESDEDYSNLNALALGVQGGRYVLVKVKKGLPSTGGYELGKDYEAVMQALEFPREVKIMAEGALLSLSGEKKLSILSLGVNNIQYKIGRVREENLSHLISQSHGDFANPAFENESFGQNNLSHVFNEGRELSDVDPKKPNYSSFDFSKYLEGGKGLFFLTVQSNDKENAEQKPHPENAKPHHHIKHHGKHGNNDAPDEVHDYDSRFILVTDLGLIVKKNIDGTRDVFVQSVSDGDPVRGVTINVLGINGEPVADAYTNGDGHATLPNLENMHNEKQPVAFVATKGDDLSFLPYARSDREVNYSKFDVNGIKTSAGLNAYMFNDRGVYRPGETAHIGMIVKARNWKETDAGVPLVLEVTNPHGQLVNRQVLELTHEGLLSADFTPRETASTGVYNAALYLGRDNNEKGLELGSIPLRVEEFLPDRMKMTSAYTQNGQPVDKLGWIKPDALQTDVNLMMLYGQPAKKRRVTGKINIAPGTFGFAEYKDYSFTAGNVAENTFDETLPETVTDDEGKAHFPIDLTKYKNSTFRLTFLGEGFEPDSGRSVKTSKSVLVSPLDYVLGVKQDSNLNYINPGDNRSISLIAVNPSLQKTAVKDVSVELKRIKVVNALTKDSNGSYSYETTTVEKSLSKTPLSIGAQGMDYVLPTKNSGSYALNFTNAEGVVLARVPFTVVGEVNAAAGFTRDAIMSVKPDKPAYKSGGLITLNIQSPYTGSGLITIETDHVHAWKWFSADTTSSTQTIRIPDDFEGKGFINIQFTRDQKSKEIFMNPFSYAVVPFAAGIDERDSHIVLDVPKDVRPGSNVTVNYRTKAPGKIILYAVDEGILLYAHYQNPNPIDHFLMQRGLEVDTSQIMDLLLPEYSLLKSLSQIGGDGFANDGKNLNPFRRKTQPPVAYWSGILDSSEDERHWTFTVPGYFNGGVRIIAVNVSDSNMGTAQSAIAVHGPLMVTPNLPLFAAPGDEFTATATITNDIKDSGKNAKIHLAIEPSDQLQVVDAPKDDIVVAEKSDVTVPIKLKATDMLGSGSLKLTASSGSEHFTVSETLSVRPPAPLYTTLKSGFAKDLTAKVDKMRLLYPQFADAHAAVSTMPVSLIGGLKDYLVNYPYGCTEQVTSQAFPNVVLYGNTELINAFGWKPEVMESGIKGAFDQLRERQNESGGFGMWSYYSTADGFVSAYAMHFLLEAKEKNLPVPEDVYEKGIQYLKEQSNEAPHSLSDAREKAYAVYVLARNGEIVTNYIPHLIDYLDSYHKSDWHSDLVTVYLAATYKLMQMDPEANNMLDSFELEPSSKYRGWWSLYSFYDSLTEYSQYVYLISKHFPERLAKMDKDVIYRVANFVGEGSYNTVSSSYAVMGLNAYVNAARGNISDLTIKEILADAVEKPLKVTGSILKVAQVTDPASALVFNSGTPGFFYQVASSGYDKTLPDKAVSEGLELTRSYIGADGKPVTKVKLGDVVTVVLALRSGSDKARPNIAIVDLLPGGFEVEPEARKAESSDEDNSDSKAKAEELPKWQPESKDAREDRMILYGEFPTEKMTYSYRIKATSRGSFVTPPPYAESMYDRALKVRGLAGKIEVE